MLNMNPGAFFLKDLHFCFAVFNDVYIAPPISLLPNPTEIVSMKSWASLVYGKYYSLHSRVQVYLPQLLYQLLLSHVLALCMLWWCT